MNAPSEHRPLSRSTSRASARSRTSTLSRNQSLIKKNIELQDLKPADVLIERFVAWKAIVKQLTAYFEGIADIENNTAKELTKLAGVIQVPFRAGNQFLGEGGLQDIYYDIRDKTRIVADQHADLGRTIDSSIVQHLNKLRAEIKAHIKNVQNDTGKLAAGVARERELSTKLVGELANAVSTLTNTPSAVHARNDPYIANQAVARQLQHQVYEENMLQKSIVIMQQNSAHFEEGIVQSIQSAWQTFDEWQSRATAASQDVFRSLATHMASLRPDHEWIQFAARSDHLLDPETPLRDPAYINYPLKDHHSTKPIHVGHLERKKRFTRSYSEAYFVLTPAGFLHEFSSSDPTTHAGQTPTFSLYLPTCTLGPASSPRAKSHKFHIEGRKDGVGTTKTGSIRGLLGGQGTLAWSFRARSHDDMLEWWNDIRELCARYLVASEQVDRTGPVEEAVRSVGYQSEEEEGVEDEDEEDEGVQTADEGEEAVEFGEAPAQMQMQKHRGRLEAHDEEAARGREPRQAQAHVAPERHEIEEEEHEGSSVEEEEGVDDHPHAAPEHEHESERAGADQTHEHEELPVYAANKPHPGPDSGVDVGPNGYAIEKKYPSLPLRHRQNQLEDAAQIQSRTKTVPRFTPKPVLVNRGNSDIWSTHVELGQAQTLDGSGSAAGNVDSTTMIASAEEDAATTADGTEGGRRLSQRQMEKAPAEGGRTSMLSMQNTGGEGVDIGPDPGPASGAESESRPYYEHDSDYEEPTHAIHRAPTGTHIKYAPPPRDPGLVSRPTVARGNSGLGARRPRSPPPPQPQQAKHTRTRTPREEVKGYDVSDDDSGSPPSGTAAAPAPGFPATPGTTHASQADKDDRPKVEEISSDEEDEDDLLEEYYHHHHHHPEHPKSKFERVKKNVGAGEVLKNGGGPAAAAAYAAQVATADGGRKNPSPSPKESEGNAHNLEEGATGDTTERGGGDEQGTSWTKGWLFN